MLDLSRFASSKSGQVGCSSVTVEIFWRRWCHHKSFSSRLWSSGVILVLSQVTFLCRSHWQIYSLRGIH